MENWDHGTTILSASEPEGYGVARDLGGSAPGHKKVLGVTLEVND